MRVTLETKEIPKSFFQKAQWVVKCVLEFSEEERAIIAHHNLGDLHLYTEVRNGTSWTLQQTMKSGGMIQDIFATALEAKQFENHLREELLPAIKNCIANSTEVETQAGPKTFEL